MVDQTEPNSIEDLLQSLSDQDKIDFMMEMTLKEREADARRNQFDSITPVIVDEDANTYPVAVLDPDNA